MIVGTAGHIDHGKTALVRALTGVDTDRLKEEKARGISIDLGFAYRAHPLGGTIGFVDVPGHERFIRNMLAGATGIDCVVFVVAADDGPMPQTREHAAIVDLLGLERGAVAITKCDLVDEERIRVVERELVQLLSSTTLSTFPRIPVSVRTGRGVAELLSLLESEARRPDPPTKGLFRLAVDRSFNLPGLGAIVTGTVFAGSVSAGDKVVISPCGIEARVRSIHAQNRASSRGSSGQRCALNLVGRDVRHNKIERGDWIVAPSLHAPTTHIDAELRLLPSESISLRHWSAVHLHIGATFAPARVAILNGETILPGETGLVQFVTERPIGALHADRYIVREPGARRTIGGGTVIDPFAHARGRRSSERLRELRQMANPSLGASLEAFLSDASQALRVDDFMRARNARPSDEAQALVETRAVCVGPRGARLAFGAERWEIMSRTVLGRLATFHEFRPESIGMTIGDLRKASALGIADAAFSSVIDRMVADGVIASSNGLLRLPNHAPARSRPADDLAHRVFRSLQGAGPRPLRISILAAQLGETERRVQQALDGLLLERLVCRVSRDLYFETRALAALTDAVVKALVTAPEAKCTVGELRDATGIGRNLLIEVLEYLDREGITSRIADGRGLGPAAKRVQAAGRIVAPSSAT